MFDVTVTRDGQVIRQTTCAHHESASPWGLLWTHAFDEDRTPATEAIDAWDGLSDLTVKAGGVRVQLVESPRYPHRNRRYPQ